MKYIYKLIILIIIIITIIFFNFFTKNLGKDGFQNYNTNSWSPDLIKRFNIYQTTMNKNVNQFDLDQIQRQVSPTEAEEYLKTGIWSWPDDLKNLYIEKVWANPIIKIDPQYALNYAMRIYNQNAVRELLAWNTKEGHFLLYGGDFGVSDGMPKNLNNTLKCVNDSSNKSIPVKKVYNGINKNGQWDLASKTTVVSYEDIPKEVKSFQFLNKPCNPCSALDSPGENICPFKLNVDGDNSISEPWKLIWNIKK